MMTSSEEPESILNQSVSSLSEEPEGMASLIFFRTRECGEFTDRTRVWQLHLKSEEPGTMANLLEKLDNVASY